MAEVDDWGMDDEVIGAAAPASQVSADWGEDDEFIDTIESKKELIEILKKEKIKNIQEAIGLNS